MKGNIEYFFDIEKDNLYGWAAWNTFLIYMNPHIVFYDLLKNKFYYALKKYNEINIKNIYDHHVVEKFIQHILLLYGRGDIQFEDEIIQELFSKMNIFFQAYAFDFASRSLKSSFKKDKIPDEVKNRFVRLWDWFLERYL